MITFMFSTALLDSLKKNGTSATDGSSGGARKRTKSKTEHSDTYNEAQNGDVPHSGEYTKDQIDAVKR